MEGTNREDGEAKGESAATGDGRPQARVDQGTQGEASLPDKY